MVNDKSPPVKEGICLLLVPSRKTICQDDQITTKNSTLKPTFEG